MPGADQINWDDDLVNPHSGMGWLDLEGAISLPLTGVGRPALATYVDDIKDYAFAANDVYEPIKFHIPHAWAPGTEMFLHCHWSHNGSNISGSLVLECKYIYAKGHNQAQFGATQKVITITISDLNITNTPARLHRIDEVPFSVAGGSATLQDTNQIEVDGLIIMEISPTTIPTITGGAAKPFIHYLDLHIQTDRTATRRRAPDFYSR